MANELTGAQIEMLQDEAAKAGLDFGVMLETLTSIIQFVTSDEFTRIIAAIRSLFAKLKPASDGKAGSILTIMSIIGTLMTLMNSDAAKKIIEAIKAMLAKRQANGDPAPDGFPPAQ